MDNVDGKQARRTGTSSGLGELFDHGIDSLNCTLASLCETAAMGWGPTKTGAFTALIPCLPMFFSTWETYHTHTLYLGYFNGPTEGLIIACSIMILSGYYGPEIWQRPVSSLVGPVPFLQDYTFRQIWIPVLMGTFFFAHLPSCILNVARARHQKGLPVAPLLLEWTPMVIYTVCVGAWLYSPTSTLLSENHLMLFCLTMSFVFGRMTTKIILAHLTRQPFPYWTVMLAPLIGGAVLANVSLLSFGSLPSVSATTELWYLRGYFLFALVAYFRWATLVIERVCTFLGINCLTIPRSSSLSHSSPSSSSSSSTTTTHNRPQSSSKESLSKDPKSQDFATGATLAEQGEQTRRRLHDTEGRKDDEDALLVESTFNRDGSAPGSRA
ncbi:MAG: hypothetical protein M1815_003434 [Lichina confinis]|nr:MAG: hypothetical protein M1815_003434 [Lichina confinis]